MRMLVTGAAGFIGSTYVRVALESRPDVELVVLDKLTYAGRRENLTDVDDRIEFVHGAIEDRDVVAEAMEGCDARRQLRRRVARRPLDRRPGRLRARPRDRHVACCSTPRAQPGVARYLQVSTDEVYGSIEEGSFTETSPLDPSSPYSATKAAGDLLVSAHVHTYGIEAVDLPRLEQLRPAPVPREADPAVRAERAARRPAAGLRRRHAGAQLALRRGLRARDRPRARARARPARSTTSAARTEAENIDVVTRDPRGHRHATSR